MPNKTISVEISRSEILNAALTGLGIQKLKVEEAIAKLKAALGMAPATSPRHKAASKATPAPKSPPRAKKPPVKRQMSEEGKVAVRAALKKRWAAYHKAQKAKKTEKK